MQLHENNKERKEGPSTSPLDVSIPPYLPLIQTCKLVFRTMDDLNLVLSFVKDFFPTEKNVVTGVHALALNAIEHGNLDIGYQYKAELLAEKRWEDEIKMRLEIPELMKRQAEIVFTRKKEGAYIIITDEGDGFKWKKYLDIDPSRAGQPHGRGIAIARSLAFDNLSYNEKGNQAVAFVANKPPINW